MRKWIKKLSCGLLCAATIGGLASCKSNGMVEDTTDTSKLVDTTIVSNGEQITDKTEFEYRIYCYNWCYGGNSVCCDQSVSGKSLEMDLTNAIEVTAVHVGTMNYQYRDYQSDHIHYIVKYKKGTVSFTSVDSD